MAQKNIYRGDFEKRISQKNDLIDYISSSFLLLISLCSVYWSFFVNILVWAKISLSGKTQSEIMG